MLAAPSRSRWRTVLGVAGAIHAVAATVLVAIVVTHHATTIRCRTLSPPAGSQEVRVVAFSPDGRMLAVGGKLGDTGLWDVADGHLIATLANPSGFSGESLVFAPDGQMLATEDDNVSAYVWNVRTRRLIATLAIPAARGRGP